MLFLQARCSGKHCACGDRSRNVETMIAAVITGMILGAIASPWLLPPILMFIRFRLFRALNGDEGIEFPNDEVRLSTWADYRLVSQWVAQVTLGSCS